MECRVVAKWDCVLSEHTSEKAIESKLFEGCAYLEKFVENHAERDRLRGRVSVDVREQTNERVLRLTVFYMRC